MISLAFKNAAKSGSKWSQLIARESGSPYSHVEFWLSGDVNKAYCFSSREPLGASYGIIDLTEVFWEIVPLKLSEIEEARVVAYCDGACGKWYNGIGLLGYRLHDEAINDGHNVFCSQVVFDALSKCTSLIDLNTETRKAWMISPGDLYKLVTAAKSAT